MQKIMQLLKPKIIIASLILIMVLIAGYFLLPILKDSTKKPNEYVTIDQSIAILPFDNMNDEPDQEYFKDGLTEGIHNSLAQLKGLKVSARTSSFKFRGNNIDIKEADVKKFAKEVFRNKSYSSFKDRIISHAIKNQRLEVCDITIIENEIKHHSAFYFLNINNGHIIAENKGLALKDMNYNGTDFYDNCTVTDYPLENDWNVIAEFVPPCNSMLIVDKYIFGHPFQTKLQSIISFINLYKANVQIPFHLTIVFSSEKNGNNICTPGQVQIAFEQIVQIGNIEVQLFLDNYIPHDRLFLTNYSSSG